MNTSNFILIIYGPTCVGKSSFVDALSEYLSVEIINCDVGQFYTSLTIGTAKPDLNNAVPHHLFDILDAPISLTVVEYRKKIVSLIKKIWKKQKIPIIVGGSAFYIKSLFFPPLNLFTSTSSNVTGDWNQLDCIDPKRASQIAPTDSYRINRALDIWKKTGKKPSELKPVYDPIADFYLLCLTRDRDDLYKRIDQRVLEMINQGWLDEVQSLMGTTWEPFIIKKKIIGYDQIIKYLENPHSKTYDSLIADIQKRTRNYAKRQMTFWRMLKKELNNEIQDQRPGKVTRNTVAECDLTSTDVALYINQLQRTLKKIIR